MTPNLLPRLLKMQTELNGLIAEALTSETKPRPAPGGMSGHKIDPAWFRPGEAKHLSDAGEAVLRSLYDAKKTISEAAAYMGITTSATWYRYRKWDKAKNV